jgi:L-threonylcarbamoyladenylate synthase
MATITDNLSQVINALSAGKVAAIPTETVYGLAADSTQPKAIEKIYALKHRPFTSPLIMHIAKNWDIYTWASYIPEYVHTLITTFWPGPLTIILPKQPQVASIITAGQESIGIRCPAHPITQAVLEGLGKPIVAPSANAFGRLSPTTPEHVAQHFQNADFDILDGGRCTVGIESTILSALHPEYFEILRPGGLSLEDIQACIPNIPYRATQHAIKHPGYSATHYQPHKPLYYFENHLQVLDTKDCYILYFNSNVAYDPAYSALLPKDAKQTHFEFYYQLYLADASPKSKIAIELPPDTPAWQSIREKIFKAGQPY